MVRMKADQNVHGDTAVPCPYCCHLPPLPPPPEICGGGNCFKRAYLYGKADTAEPLTGRECLCNGEKCHNAFMVNFKVHLILYNSTGVLISLVRICKL